MDMIIIKNLYSAKDTIKRKKNQYTDAEKIIQYLYLTKD